MRPLDLVWDPDAVAPPVDPLPDGSDVPDVIHLEEPGAPSA